MDWKRRTGAHATKFEKAKDVTAFANHLGGTILVAADEVNGRLGTYDLDAVLASWCWRRFRKIRE